MKMVLLLGVARYQNQLCGGMSGQAGSGGCTSDTLPVSITASNTRKFKSMSPGTEPITKPYSFSDEASSAQLQLSDGTSLTNLFSAAPSLRKSATAIILAVVAKDDLLTSNWQRGRMHGIPA
jgi:hypothetical protein